MKDMRKVAPVLSVLLSVTVIILAFLQIFDIYDSINIYMPILGVINLLSAYIQWPLHRKTAYFSLVVAVFIFICSLLIFLIR